MKKIALVLVAAMVLVFTGCEKKETISMPFDVADVNNIEMYRNVVPNSAEKQVITKTDDIEDIYFLFSGLEVSDKKTEPVAGGTVTSFRFNLSNDTSYEIIYCAEAVSSCTRRSRVTTEILGDSCEAASFSPRQGAKALSYCQPRRGGGVKVLLRYFLTRK